MPRRMEVPRTEDGKGFDWKAFYAQKPKHPMAREPKRPLNLLEIIDAFNGEPVLTHEDRIAEAERLAENVIRGRTQQAQAYRDQGLKSPIAIPERAEVRVCARDECRDVRHAISSYQGNKRTQCLSCSSDTVVVRIWEKGEWQDFEEWEAAQLDTDDSGELES